MIVNNKEGLLVNKGSVEELAGAIHKLLLDKNLARRLAESAFQKVKKEYGLNRVIMQTQKLYESLCAE